jgi:SAM-dependent methyltransferase
MRTWIRGGSAVVLAVALAGCSSRSKSDGSAVDAHAMEQGRARMLQAAERGPGVGQEGGSGTGTRATSTPYVGDLSIFEYPGRDKKLQIDRVMKILGIGPGKSVADIGAGSGWFTVRAARKVGPAGLVYAEEINPEAVKYIDERAAKEKLTNIKTVLGTPDDPKLPPASVDAVLMLKMYHEIARPVAVMKAIRLALKPGAKVGIIDRNGNGSGQDHGVPSETVIDEMREAGFGLVQSYDFTKADGEDYFLEFVAE